MSLADALGSAQLSIGRDLIERLLALVSAR